LRPQRLTRFDVEGLQPRSVQELRDPI
jgi:hypothetical protein